MKIGYTNYRKEFPNMGKNCFNRFFSFDRRWEGKLIYFHFFHHQIEIDIRKNWIKDMCNHDR